MTIYFYVEHDKPYGCFSNFSPHGFWLDELYWQTSEHYFQAQKFIGTPYLERVQHTKTPKEAANMGRDRSLPLRSDWNQVKDDVMRKAVMQKFQTHLEIRDILLSTADELLIENSPIDYYWGCGKDGTGRNKLGQILMEVRSTLQMNILQAEKV